MGRLGPMAKRLTIKTTRQPAVVVSRTAVHSDHLVYLACANSMHRYPHGRSRIVYIGTTKNGVDRVASSAARTARKFLNHRGVKTLEFFVVTCKRRPGVKAWRKLERGLLLAFKAEFGAVPHGNTQGKNAHWEDELDYFKYSRLGKVIREYSMAAQRSRGNPRRRR